MNDFEIWLQKKFLSTDGLACTKDAFDTAFERWMDNLQIDEWLEHGQEYRESLNPFGWQVDEEAIRKTLEDTEIYDNACLSGNDLKLMAKAIKANSTKWLKPVNEVKNELS